MNHGERRGGWIRHNNIVINNLSSYATGRNAQCINILFLLALNIPISNEVVTMILMMVEDDDDEVVFFSTNAYETNYCSEDNNMNIHPMMMMMMGAIPPQLHTIL